MSKFDLNSLVAEHANAGNKFYPPFAATAELEAQAKDILACYEEQPRSAVLPLLHVIQHKHGYINKSAINWVAAQINVEPVKVLEVVSFYPGLRQYSPGRIHFRICRTLSCALAGSDVLFEKLCQLCNIDANSVDPHHHPIAVSPCGNWSVEFVECLAACGSAPVVIANDTTHFKVAPEQAEQLVKQYTAE